MSVTKVPSTATCPCHRRRLFSSYSPSPNIKYSTILKLSAAAKTSLTTNHSSSSRQKENHFLKLVNRSCKVGSYDEALYFLECMASQGHRPGTVFCTKLIRGFLKASMIEKGERVMEILERHGTPDTISYNVLAAGTLASLSDYSCGEFLKRMGKHGCSPDTVTYNTLIGALCAGDQLSPAFELLDRMMMGDDHRPTITTYMILVETAVRSYVGGGGSGTLSTSFVTLLLDRIPSEEAYNAVLRRMCREGLVDGAWEILHKSLLLQSHSYCRPSVKSCNILLRGLLDQRRWEDAEKLVSEMVSPSTDIQQPDIVTYNIMISSLCREGMPEKAVTVLKDMMAAGMKPIAGTYNNFDPLVSSYCKQGRTDLAVKFINYIAVNYSGRYVLDILNYNTILSSLCKSGEIDEAMKIFDGLESAGCAPNTSTYNAMIGGLWNNGRKQIAVEMVGNMMNRGVEFDDVTYNVLISCLCRDGMVDSAVRLMRDMEQSNGFRPNVITYNSLILGFCKSQRVELAVDVFTEMVEMRRCLPNQSTYVILVEGVAYAGHRGLSFINNKSEENNVVEEMEIGGRRTVDLRSDTVTKPSAAMYRAMTTAEVDDDCSGNGDPTARLLELEMASRFRKEASLFVPSGTMANLISVLIHCDSRGSEIIVGNNSHIHLYENGGISVLGGIHSRTVPNNADGTIDIELLRAAIREPNDIHFPVTKLICLENTHASCGGKCITAEYTDIVGDLAKEHGLKLHIDGARIFNASVALDVPVDRLVRAADSVSVCMSKGLGAPVGSLILGSKDFISKAKKLRKTLGGGMRQIGVLCAAALVGLHDNVPKLIDDHIHAMLFASGLSLIQGIVGIRPHEIQTNMVFFDIAGDLDISPKNFLQLLSEEHGIIATLSPTMRIRAVFHYQITEDDVHYTLASIKKTIQQIRLDASSKLIYQDCNTMDTSSKLIYHS